MRILSRAEREAASKKRAAEAGQKVKQPQQNTNTVDRIKEQLQKLGYKIADEKALAEINVPDGKLQLDQISMWHAQGVISLNEEDSEKEAPVQQKTPGDTRQPKIFSVSEVVEEEPVAPQKDRTEAAAKTTEQRIEELKKQRQQKVEKSQQTASQKKIEEKGRDAEGTSEEPEWVKNYPASLQKWCGKNVDKKTGQTKREVKEIRTNSDDKQNPVVDIEVAPLSPIARKRGDYGAVYTVKKSPQPEKIDVTLTSKEPGKALDYDYFYALVKAAHDSGADTIEFNNIRTPEFRDKLLAAALQFKMKLKNPPGVINLEAEHLQTIPAGCRQYLEKHNDAVKKVMQERRKEIVPEKGQKYGTGPRAEDRTHAEQEAIESEQIMEKNRRAEKRRQEMEQEDKAAAEEEHQYFENGRKKSSKRQQTKQNRPWTKGREM